MQRSLLTPLSDVRHDDGPVVGPKAVNLARLMARGLPVPGGFCVVAHAYREHLRHPDVMGRCPKGAQPDIEALASLRKAIIAAPIPHDLAEAVAQGVANLGAGRLAVRSSSTVEDTAQLSFAGQYDSFLEIEGPDDCLHHVKRCWASFWTDRAVDYRSRHGLGHDGAMAVIVQTLVEAEVAGVAFTADPQSGRRDRIVIEGAAGFGEAVASGRVAPERIRLAKSDLRMLARAGERTSLDDRMIGRLGRILVEAEQIFEAPIDAEWATAGGSPSLLQARPITSLPPEPSWDDRQVWTNANGAEVVPDVMSPLTESFIMAPIHNLVRMMSRTLGLDLGEAGHGLWRLAIQAHEDPDLRAAVVECESYADLRARLDDQGLGKDFSTAWAAYAFEYGHHTRGEVELMNARWAECPDELLRMVRSYVLAIGEHDPLERAAGLARDRAELKRSCLERLRNPAKRAAFRIVLRYAEQGAPIRENIKSEMVRRLALARSRLLELGRRFADGRTLDRSDDIFFLKQDEFELLIRDRSDVRERVRTRREVHERNESLAPPPIVRGHFDPEQIVPEALPTDDILGGVAVSPGVVTGPARVILRSGTDHVRAGEILVAPFTDPGWTPYFLNAAAIVMDIGGLLSHGAIVAREYGIPCVVNVGPATKILRTGQPLRVDGTRGRVEILTEAGGG